MFCPRCGAPMTPHGDTMKCTPGDMPLSLLMLRGLHETFISRTRPPLDPDLLTRRHTSAPWYCPGCGQRMLTSEGIIHCAACERTLNPFIYRLIELHPHNPL